MAYDLHPNYMSTRYAQERSQEENIPAYGIQHHHAHIAACMAENDHPGDRPVIGLAFDGTGFGTDETIWGGEVLLADYKGFQRISHLLPVRLPGGDSAVKEPWRVALSWLDKAGLSWDKEYKSVQEGGEEKLGILKNQIQSGINAPYTSSMGRLFDAAAALAGVRQTVNYEAQAAIEFEAFADPNETGHYSFEIHDKNMDPRPLFTEIVKDVQGNTPISTISAKFHNSIADMAYQVCKEIRKQTGVEEVALSGGVWQNMVLLKKAYSLLVSGGFTVYLHKDVPTNDGGISLGQAVIAYHTIN
jgi:hydrogenase maturation protein HypF